MIKSDNKTKEIANKLGYKYYDFSDASIRNILYNDCKSADDNQLLSLVQMIYPKKIISFTKSLGISIYNIKINSKVNKAAKTYKDMLDSQHKKSLIAEVLSFAKKYNISVNKSWLELL